MNWQKEKINGYALVFIFGFVCGTLLVVGFSLLDWGLQDIVSIFEIVSALALVGTLGFIVRQAKATEDLVKNEVRPRVFLDLFSDTIANVEEENLEKMGTIFRFTNLSNFPCLVWLKLNLQVDGHACNDFLEASLRGEEVLFRVPSGGVRTRPYDFLVQVLRKRKLEVSTIQSINLQIELFASPVFDQKLKILCDSRSYRFDIEEKCWIDNKLGIKDK